jgi:hypothetical protein
MWRLTVWYSTHTTAFFSLLYAHLPSFSIYCYRSLCIYIRQLQLTLQVSFHKKWNLPWIVAAIWLSLDFRWVSDFWNWPDAAADPVHPILLHCDVKYIVSISFHVPSSSFKIPRGQCRNSTSEGVTASLHIPSSSLLTTYPTTWSYTGPHLS